MKKNDRAIKTEKQGKTCCQVTLCSAHYKLDSGHWTMHNPHILTTVAIWIAFSDDILKAVKTITSYNEFQLNDCTVDTSASHSGHYCQPQWTLLPATVDITASHSGHWPNVQRHCNGDSALSRCGKSRRTNVWGKFQVVKRPQRPWLLVLYLLSLPNEVRARHVSVGSDWADRFVQEEA